jgi:CheY-like chemotaxis protein
VKTLGKVLLVEDNVRDVDLILAALAKNNLANEVVVARHGGEALDYLHRRGEFHTRPPDNPSVVLLDLKTPKMDGLEVLRQMKSDDDLKIIPVVILTSSREEADLARSYELGANSYVVKPFDVQQFADAIRQLGMFWAVVNEPPQRRAKRW